MKIDQRRMSSLLKGAFLCALAGIVTSCCMWITYDELSLYKPGYDPHYSPKLRVDGFYSRVGGGWSEGLDLKYRDYIKPIFFYCDGSFAMTCQYPSTHALHDNMPAGWACWGFYVLSNDTIQIETLIVNSEACHTEKSQWSGHLVDNALVVEKVIDSHTGKRCPWEEGTYIFQPFDRRPNPEKNWIKTDKKYRLQND